MRSLQEGDRDRHGDARDPPETTGGTGVAATGTGSEARQRPGTTTTTTTSTRTDKAVSIAGTEVIGFGTVLTGRSKKQEDMKGELLLLLLGVYSVPRYTRNN